MEQALSLALARPVFELEKCYLDENWSESNQDQPAPSRTCPAARWCPLGPADLASFDSELAPQFSLFLEYTILRMTKDVKSINTA